MELVVGSLGFGHQLGRLLSKGLIDLLKLLLQGVFPFGNCLYVLLGLNFESFGFGHFRYNI